MMASEMGYDTKWDDSVYFYRHCSIGLYRWPDVCQQDRGWARRHIDDGSRLYKVQHGRHQEATAAAARLYHTDVIQDKKQYVMDFLSKKNLKINPDELDKMIEAAVLEINKEWAEVAEEKKEEAADEESKASE